MNSRPRRVSEQLVLWDLKTLLPPNPTIAYNRLLKCTQSITTLLDVVIVNLGSLGTNYLFSTSSFGFRLLVAFNQLVVVCKTSPFRAFLWGFSNRLPFLRFPSRTELCKKISLFPIIISINNSTQQPRTYHNSLALNCIR